MNDSINAQTESTQRQPRSDVFSERHTFETQSKFFFPLIKRQILLPVRYIYLMFEEDCSDSMHFLRGGPSCAVWPSQMLCIHVVRCVSWHGKGCLDGIQLFRLHFQPQMHSWGSRPSRSPVPNNSTHTFSLSYTAHPLPPQLSTT